MCFNRNLCCCSVGCIRTSELGIVERFGKYDRTLEPGCFCLNPFSALRGVLSLRVKIMDLKVESKTKGNAIIIVSASIHYRVLRDRATDAFYRFSAPEEQIGSFAGNVIRGFVPKMTVDEIFEVRDEMQKAIKEELEEKLALYGFEIIASLITDIDLNEAVKQAMSQINTNARIREAASYEADAGKIKLVKAAEADAEVKRLSGVGLAEQRKAAIKGLQTSVKRFTEECKEIPTRDIMGLLMMNQYFDAMKDVAQTGHNEVILLPNMDTSSMSQTQSMVAAMAGMH